MVRNWKNSRITCNQRRLEHASERWGRLGWRSMMTYRFTDHRFSPMGTHCSRVLRTIGCLLCGGKWSRFFASRQFVTSTGVYNGSSVVLTADVIILNRFLRLLVHLSLFNYVLAASYEMRLYASLGQQFSSSSACISAQSDQELICLLIGQWYRVMCISGLFNSLSGWVDHSHTMLHKLFSFWLLVT